MTRMIYAGICCAALAFYGASAAAQDLTIEREILGNGEYTAGSTLDIEITFRYTGGTDVQALGLVENLPAGWTYNSLVSNTNNPAVQPNENEGSPLEFAWLVIPDFPFTMTYRVNVPAETTGSQVINGQGLFRTTGDEEQSPNESTTVYALGTTPDPGEKPEDAACGCAPSGAGSAGFLGDGLVALALCGVLVLARRQRKIQAIRLQ